MSKPCFLFDECTHGALVPAVRQLKPSFDALRVVENGAPPTGAADADLLLAAFTLGRVVVSNDMRSMPGHLIDHYKAGHWSAGLILLHGGHPTGLYARCLVDLWTATTAAEWIDRTVYLP